MAVLYVASDRSGVGKTALSASLASILAEEGLSVGVIKPFAGPDDTDVSAYADLLGASQPSPPLARPSLPAPSAPIIYWRFLVLAIVAGYGREGGGVG